MTLDDMVAAYREAAIRHGDGSESGNVARCNAGLDDLERVRADLRRQGPEGIARIRALLEEHDRVVIPNRGRQQAFGVGRIARAHDLQARHRGEHRVDGLRVLREVANGPLGMIRLAAEMVIEEWEAGRSPPRS